MLFQNLFAFGDKDGALYEAKLQHSLGVAVTADGKTLFVADTYNHKLKKVDVSENKISTLQFSNTIDTTDGTSSTFKEPAGLCVSADGKRIFLADTNNHQVKVVTLGRNSIISRIEKLDIRYSSVNFNGTFSNPLYHFRDSETLKITHTTSNNIVSVPKPLKVSTKGGKVVLKFTVQFNNGLKLTADAPQKWIADLPGPTYSCIPKNGTDLKNLEMVLNFPPQKDKTDEHVDVSFNLVTCTEETCLPKVFVVRVPFGFSESGSVTLDREVNVILGINSINVE